MKIKKYYILSELANYLLLLTVLYSAVGMINIFYGFNIMPQMYIAIAFYVMIVYFTRKIKFSYSGTLVGALDLIIAFFIFLLPIGIPTKVIIILIGIATLLLNIKYFTSKPFYTIYELPIPFILAPVLGFLYSDYIRNTFYMVYFFALAIIFVLLYYIRLFNTNAFVLASERNKYDKMPYKEMIINDMKLAVPFIVISVLLMILVNFDFMDAVMVKIYAVFTDVFVFFAKYVLAAIRWLIETFIEEADEPLEPIKLPEIEDEIRESAFINILGYVIFGIVAIVLVLLVAITVRNIIKSMRGARKDILEDNIETGMTEVKERITRTRKSKDSSLSSIRKKYKKTIEKLAKKGYQLFWFHTPNERSKDVLDKNKIDINELTKEYEKDRYSHL